MRYNVNDEGVMALKTMSAAIFGAIDEIKELTGALTACADDHQESLGPHKASIDKVIEDIKNAANDATEPVNSIAEALNEVAESYQEVIDNDRIAGTGGNP